MKTTLKYYVSYVRLAGVALCGALLLFGCSKEERPTKDPQYRTDVYMAGQYESQAAYWKNGEKVMLELSNDTEYSMASSIFMDEGDIHVIGYEDNGSDYVSRYWKNGAIVPFADGESLFIDISAMFVSNGDVYLAGVSNTGGKDVATYWKNGKRVVLSSALAADEYEYVSSIFISGNDVYVAGAKDSNNKNIAKYWKNGTPVVLSDGAPNAYTHGIFVAGNDVYVTGSENTGTHRVATYWKNGQPTRLTDGTSDAEAITVFVSDGNVYVSGLDYAHGEGNKYWKNGVVTKIEDNYTEGCWLFVSDGDVYVTGSVQNGSKYRAAYWKNGQRVLLTDGTENDSDVYAVFVAKTLE